MKTPKQIENQNLLINALQNAGWAWNDVSKEQNKVDFIYQNAYVSLSIVEDEEEDAVYLALQEENIALEIHYEAHLQEFLNLLIHFQSSIKKENFKDLIGEILNICPKTYLDTGEDLIPLHSEDSK